MAIKLGVHVQVQDGSKGFISAIRDEVIEVTLRDGAGVVEASADTLKTLKGRPRKVEVAVEQAAGVGEAEASASV